MASSSSSSSSPSVNSAHDVFLSFRGEDTRAGFVSHLHTALERKAITPFKDDEIVKGRSIGPELYDAIGASKISIVAFSDNYASSSWCLDELAEIMKCRDERGQIVIPIFYDVDPSHVRKQTHGFGEIFKKTCKGRTEEDKLRWRRALTDVANIAGVDSRNWGNEAKMVEKIVNDVSYKLNSTTANDFDDMVGLEGHMKTMDLLLNLESDDVIMVGIWGQSGVGKTTIGRALFSEFSCQFQYCLFIDKTKEFYRRANSDDYNTRLYLQTQFLSEILELKDVKIRGLGAVREKLGDKRVLLVFDDVDDQVLFNALVGDTTWFGPGSRIVVISKSKELLGACGIESDRIHEVALPSEELAFQMFCRCAFGQDFPPEGFVEPATDAVKLTGNLPLCLNVLGSSLRGVKKEEWQDRLPKLVDCMAGKFNKTLRDSYDSLREEHKAIFLHIACLFNHKTCDFVRRLLEDSRLGVEAGLATLADRCLIQISEDMNIRMHDFLQKMGREIVRQPCILEPGERQFLMDAKEICDVLVDGTGTLRVLGISFNLSEIEDTLSISEKSFRRMKNLRFLSIYGILPEGKEVILHLLGGQDHFWRQLRLLEWWGCSLRCMPSNFCPANLVELRMPDSHLEKLWDGPQLLKRLKKMDLRRSKKLKEFPDLSKAINLEELYLGDCWSLVLIPYSIRNLKKLRKLDMKRCKNLQILPTNVDLESLYSLDLSGCSRLRSFPHISRNISNLFLDETEIQEIPGWIEEISGLNYLLMNGCSNLEYISPNISKLIHLEMIFFSNSDSSFEESWYDSPSAVATEAGNMYTQLPDASSSCNWKNDVYLSFCREDVGKTLVSHLNAALEHNLITTSMFDGIGIRDSRIAVVVLSKNYFSSSRCLDELVKIMKCAEEIGLKVIPIYYGMEPAHIRTHISELKKTFEKTCENQNNTVDMQLKWVRALTVVKQLHGYHSITWDSEAELIQKIAADISFGLNFTPSLEFPAVVGIEDQMAKMKLLICLESEEVRMFGVWGPPGIGKSTITRALFHQLSCQFQSRAFIDRALVAKTMEQYKRDNLDNDHIKLRLQTQFLSQILEKKKNGHSGVVGKRVQDLRVLIVIDDVDDNQVVLEALAGQAKLFGCGSKIIVISKDKQLLRAHGIESIYEVVTPSQEVALDMFCRSAFLQTFPLDGFEKLAVEVTQLAGNLPLDLKVLGSCLRGMKKKEWIELLPRLRSSPHREMEKIFKLHYNGLNGNEKALFRHIACFLNNETHENVIRLLGDSKLDVRVGLKILYDKSLIQISEERIISMHHVLQKIGRDKALGPFINHPANRQFLMDTSEACHVLIDQTGPENVFGISFKGLKKLKYLRTYKESLYGKEVRFHLVEGLNSLRDRLNNT